MAKLLLAGFGAGPLFALLWGCSGQIVTQDASSPDGELVLRVATEKSGGAAAFESIGVYVFPAKTIADHKLIFKGTALSAFSARWVGLRHIELSYATGHVSICHASVPSEGFNVTVSGCGVSPSAPN